MSHMSVGAHELHLYIENDGILYRQQGQPILKNLATKKAKGEYDHAKAVKLYMHYMDAGAKKYAKEFGGGAWNVMFPVADRKQAAEAFARDFEAEYALGNYNGYIPKKYQPKAPSAPKAKKSSRAASRRR